jgi:hypothetical protein
MIFGDARLDAGRTVGGGPGVLQHPADVLQIICTWLGL